MIRRSYSRSSRAPRERTAQSPLTLLTHRAAARRRAGALVAITAATVGTLALAPLTAAAADVPNVANGAIEYELVDTATGVLRVPTATTQQNVIILTNQQRARVGAPALRYSMALTIAAQRHANDMAKMNRLTHTGSDGSSPGTRMRKAGFSWTRCAENAAAGQTSSTQVVQAWMNSYGHRVNMLNKSYGYIGIGIAYGAGRIWWVMDLAA